MRSQETGITTMGVFLVHLVLFGQVVTLGRSFLIFLENKLGRNVRIEIDFILFHFVFILFFCCDGKFENY